MFEVVYQYGTTRAQPIAQSKPLLFLHIGSDLEEKIDFLLAKLFFSFKEGSWEKRKKCFSWQFRT